MLTPDYPPNTYGGIGTHAYELSIQLAEQGHEVTVIVAKLRRHTNEPDHYNVEQNGRLLVVRYPTDLRTELFPELPLFNYKKMSIWAFKFAHLNLSLFPEIIKFIENKKPFDLIHAHDSYHAITAVSLKETLNIPLVSTIHSVTSPANHFNDSLRRYMILNSDKVITVSEWMQKNITERYHVFTNDIKVIRNGVRAEDFKTSTEQHAKNEKKITYIGRLANTKGCDTLIAAFANVVDQGRFNMKLIIVGEGPEMNALKELVSSYKVEDKVVFTGYLTQKEIREVLGSSFLHIVPSREEPFGITALEALSAGVPTIVSSVGGLQEIIVNNWNGLTFSPDNVYDLGNKIVQLTEDMNLRDIFIRNGLETAHKYSWVSITQETEKLYKLTVKQRQGETTLP
ncbi:glycosyltransferase family 4 protein [Paenibacillus glucanolyticus]